MSKKITMFSAHATVRKSIQIGPDEWETFPVVMDVDGDTTIGDIIKWFDEHGGLCYIGDSAVTIAITIIERGDE